MNPSTLALLYTPANEHFGIVPIEAMACGLPVLACDSGGPTESIIASPPNETKDRTGWLKTPDPEVWAKTLGEIVSLTKKEKEAMKKKARTRARTLFGMEAMAKGIDEALREAEAMGKVNALRTEGYEIFKTLLLMIVGFLLAYFAAPYLIPTA